MVGIFMLRNRLSGNEDEEKITITTNIRKRKTRRKKNGSKISILDRIQDEYISKKWIGAG
jgi:hypothetical protein